MDTLIVVFFSVVMTAVIVVIGNWYAHRRPTVPPDEVMARLTRAKQDLAVAKVAAARAAAEKRREAQEAAIRAHHDAHMVDKVRQAREKSAAAEKRREAEAGGYTTTSPKVSVGNLHLSRDYSRTNHRGFLRSGSGSLTDDSFVNPLNPLSPISVWSDSGSSSSSSSDSGSSSCSSD